MVNYYDRFLPHIAATMAPLYAALNGKPKTLTWTSSHAAAFDKAKRALSDADYLGFPMPGLPLLLSIDTSDIAIGAVLKQVLHGAKQPLAFFSRKLSPTESRYSTFDRELFAVYTVVHHFRHLIEGSSFTIQTDHLLLVHAFPKKSDTHSARQQRHLSAISEFICTLQHVLVRKILSPTPSPGTPLPLYASASTTSSSPVYSNRILRCPLAESSSLPFGGKTSPSTTTATPSSVTSAPATLAHGTLFSFVNASSTSSMAWHTPPLDQQRPSGRRNTSGTASPRTLRLGSTPGFHVNKPRSIDTPNQESGSSLNPNAVLLTSTSTSLALSPHQKATDTCSQSSTAQRVGPKQYPWSTPLQPPVPLPSYSHGSPDLAFLST